MPVSSCDSTTEQSTTDSPYTLTRLYTPATLAELVGVPVAAVRHWHRRGILLSCRTVNRLPHFDLREVAVARHLASLYQAGCSLRTIERKLDQLERQLPEQSRPLTDPAVAIEGRKLILHRGADRTEPNGQLLIDFDESDLHDELPLVLPMTGIENGVDELAAADHAESWASRLQQAALDYEARGDLDRAIEARRLVLATEGPSAEENFLLADLLYRQGDLSAARERYYMAIETDDAFVEARANLGCVLAALGELELAVAAFEGALHLHEHYAEVHFHLADALDQLGRQEDAASHWDRFLQLAPAGPWADVARERLVGR